ncbi:hypothetical protein [Dulcicalothrix desertica]|uniref:hypothetical protein n=1 Tax=Dulcicalothrix desertica TaxID=32056 RepID=UPI001315986F|nr:hypothetical protein [Dulcicalothrix desertica]
MSDIEISDERMRALVCSDSSLQKLTNGAVHNESPVYLQVIWYKQNLYTEV